MGNESKSPNIILRFLWFLIVGWEVGIAVLVFSLVCAVTIIGVPIAMFLIDHLPLIMTLKARSRSSEGRPKQHNIILRVLYFIFLGSWISVIWTLIAVLCHLSIIGSPLAFVMVDKLPYVATLDRY